MNTENHIVIPSAFKEFVVEVDLDGHSTGFVQQVFAHIFDPDDQYRRLGHLIGYPSFDPRNGKLYSGFLPYDKGTKAFMSDGIFSIISADEINDEVSKKLGNTYSGCYTDIDDFIKQVPLLGTEYRYPDHIIVTDLFDVLKKYTGLKYDRSLLKHRQEIFKKLDNQNKLDNS